MDGFDVRDITLVVGTPCYGGAVFDRYMTSYEKMRDALREYNIKVARVSMGTESLIPRGRNRLVHSFLGMGAQFYLQIDADIEFEPNAVMGLLASKKRVVACAYPIKNYDMPAVVEAVKRGDQKPERFATKLAINPLVKGNEQKTDMGCILVRDVATGFLMIERNVFFEMMEKYPSLYYFSDVGPGTMEYGLPLYTLFDCQIVEEQLWDNGPKLPRYLSEDYLFCRRWQEMGGEVWLYLGANLNHIGQMTYHGDISNMFQAVAVDQTQGVEIVKAPPLGENQ